MVRVNPTKWEHMTDAQRRVHEEIASGPRGSVRGPFQVLLKSPEVASRMQRVGEYLRFKSILPARLRMLGVLIVARAWTAQYEWQVHVPQAIEAGLAEETIRDLATRKRPSLLQSDEVIVYDFCSELQNDKRVRESTFRAAVELLGEQGVVELTALNGYFTAVAMTLNVFDVDVPDKSKALLT